MARPKPKPKPPKYDWVSYLEVIICLPSPHGGQTIGRLWEADSLSPFHDKALASATKEINAILRRVEESKPEKDLELSFIAFQDRPFLVWSSYGAVGPYDDDDKIAKALGLKTKA